MLNAAGGYSRTAPAAPRSQSPRSSRAGSRARSAGTVVARRARIPRNRMSRGMTERVALVLHAVSADEIRSGKRRGPRVFHRRASRRHVHWRSRLAVADTGVLGRRHDVPPAGRRDSGPCDPSHEIAISVPVARGRSVRLKWLFLRHSGCYHAAPARALSSHSHARAGTKIAHPNGDPS